MTLPSLTIPQQIAVGVGVVFALILIFPKRTAYALGILVSVYRHVMQIKRDEPEVDPPTAEKRTSRPTITGLGATISEVNQPTPPSETKP